MVNSVEPSHHLFVENEEKYDKPARKVYLRAEFRIRDRTVTPRKKKYAGYNYNRCSNVMARSKKSVVCNERTKDGCSIEQYVTTRQMACFNDTHNWQTISHRNFS